MASCEQPAGAKAIAKNCGYHPEALPGILTGTSVNRKIIPVKCLTALVMSGHLSIAPVR
jgi:hypothetical protein